MRVVVDSPLILLVKYTRILTFISAYSSRLLVCVAADETELEGVGVLWVSIREDYAVHVRIRVL